MRANNVEAMRPGRKPEHPKIVREFNVGRVPTRTALIRIG
jgi:DNA-binding GntR family transcriptional regulator